MLPGPTVREKGPVAEIVPGTVRMALARIAESAVSRMPRLAFSVVVPEFARTPPLRVMLVGTNDAGVAPRAASLETLRMPAFTLTPASKVLVPLSSRVPRPSFTKDTPEPDRVPPSVAVVWGAVTVKV